MIPVLGLGTWKLTRDTAEVVRKAIECGYRMIDTASDYGSQTGIGEAIPRCGIDRSDLFVTTKIEEDDDAYQAVRRDLGELEIQYADLTLIHRPPDSGAGERLWNGLVRARTEGLVRDIGVSNYSAELIDELIDQTGEVPAVHQVEWSPFGHSDALKNHHEEHGIQLQAYSPLTRGERLDDPRLREIAGAHDRSPAQVLIRWNLQEGVIPLPKANSEDHFRENIDVFSFTLSGAEVERLNGMNEQYSALGTLPYI